MPMVIRAPYGGGIHGPEHHSESTEIMFAHMPGLRVVIPSSPYQAYGLLLAAPLPSIAPGTSERRGMPSAPPDTKV